MTIRGNARRASAIWMVRLGRSQSSRGPFDTSRRKSRSRPEDYTPPAPELPVGPNDVERFEKGVTQGAVPAIAFVRTVEDDARHAGIFEPFQDEFRPFLERLPGLGHGRASALIADAYGTGRAATTSAPPAGRSARIPRRCRPAASWPRRCRSRPPRHRSSISPSRARKARRRLSG